MAVKVRIPTPLQKLTNNQGEVACEAKTINEMLEALEKMHRVEPLSAPRSDTGTLPPCYQ